MRKQMIKRFLKYVRIDTQSKEDVDQYPSTEKQKKLLHLLVEELKNLGCNHADIDEHSYVTGTYPSNLEHDSNIPSIGLIAHVDTSPDVSGKDVKPIIHENYQGGAIKIGQNNEISISPEDNPELENFIGNDIITSDGTTLLGADNKAGIAEILTTIQYLKDHPEIKHGEIKIAFTPDEEIGKGTEYFDVDKFGADYAYTVDGKTVGEIENENFNAALAEITINGINVHPGYAKDKLVNSIKIASELVEILDEEPAPENTEGREGYIHPYKIEGGVESTTIKVYLRDFEEEGLQDKKETLNRIYGDLLKAYPKAEIKIKIKDQYKNMKSILDDHPEVVQYALEAAEQAGLEPELNIIRGGTDGARLCAKGLPTPNIFTGGHNFHSKREWISIQGMEKTVETLINLLKLWAQKNK